MSNFTGSVAGLEVGADVTLHGLKIGEVTDVALATIRRSSASSRLCITASPPSASPASPPIQGLPPGTLAAEMVRRGFRATLQAPSLISGGKIVALEYMPDAPPAELRREGDVFVVPSSEGGSIDSLARSASELLSKINRIDFDRHRQQRGRPHQGPRRHDQRSADQGHPGRHPGHDAQARRRHDAGAGAAARDLAAAPAGAHPGQPPVGVSQHGLRRRFANSAATSRACCASSPTRCVRCARWPICWPAIPKR